MARVTHLADLMHRAEASNGTAIPSNWILSTDGTKALAWRPETSSSGSVSYGSNATHVSDSSDGGAASSASRSDHRHRGVRTISHASNTYVGDVTFQTEGSLYIVKPAPGILKFGSTSSGGVGGAALTIEEVDGSPTVSATKLVLPNGTLGVVGTVATYTPAAGGSVSWTQDLSEDGTSFANFTASGGTWASDGTTINQTSTAGAFSTARHNTVIPLGYGAIVECEVRFPTAGTGTEAFRFGGIILGSNTTERGMAILLDSVNDIIKFQHWNVADVRTLAFTVALDTWYKLRLVNSGTVWTLYVDGTLKFSSVPGTISAIADYVSLGVYGTTVNFRNIKAWTLSGGAPA